MFGVIAWILIPSDTEPGVLVPRRSSHPGALREGGDVGRGQGRRGRHCHLRWRHHGRRPLPPPLRQGAWNQREDGAHCTWAARAVYVFWILATECWGKALGSSRMGLCAGEGVRKGDSNALGTTTSLTPHPCFNSQQASPGFAMFFLETELTLNECAQKRRHLQLSARNAAGQ